MKIVVIILCILFFYSFEGIAQKEERYEKEENQEQQEYDKEFTYGLNWNTNGSFLGGVNLKFAWQRKKIQTQYHLFSLEIVSVVHPRELTFGSYVREKAGSFYVIRPSFGREIVIFNKAQEEGVQISWINAAGLSLGYWKPYYILFEEKPDIDATLNIDESIVVVKRYTEGINENQIVGSSSFFKGFDELINYTGIHYKTSLNFEYGRFRNSVAGIEIGVMFELMPKEITLLYKAENKQFFTSLFVNLYLGIR